MLYVGHAKFRWRPMKRVLRAVEPVAAKVGRVGLVGVGWAQLPWWASEMAIEDCYYVRPTAYLQRLDVEVIPPVPFGAGGRLDEQAVFNPVLLRPIFRHMQFVTPRIFETPAANTIPLFGFDPCKSRKSTATRLSTCARLRRSR